MEKVVLGSIVGFVVGWVAGWLVKSRNRDDGWDRRQLEKYKDDTEKYRQEAAAHEIEANTLTSLLEDRVSQLEKSEVEKKEIRARLDEMQSKFVEANSKVAAFDELRENMKTEFRVMSLDLLESQKKSAHEEQVKALSATINPFRDQIKELREDFDKQIKDILKNSENNKVDFGNHMKQMLEKSGALQKEAADLTRALRGDKQLQGSWGEMQLETLFGNLGWKNRRNTEDGMYETQKTYKTEENKEVKPDFVVYMPDDRNLVIDSKVTLNSYVDYRNEENEEAKNALWKKFVKNTRDHINGLSEKGYNKIVDGKFAFTCLFMPLEHAYIELMHKETSLYKESFDKNIVIVTSSLLLPVLRTIETLMKVERQNKNVGEAIKTIEELNDRYCGFFEEYQKTGRAIATIQGSYEQGMTRLTGKQGVSKTIAKMVVTSGAIPKKTLQIERYSDSDDDE